MMFEVTLADVNSSSFEKAFLGLGNCTKLKYYVSATSLAIAIVQDLQRPVKNNFKE